MGNLFLVIDSFELSNLTPEKRDLIFRDFCNAIDISRKDKDLFFALEEIHNRHFSYGTLFYDFFYKSWPEINKNPNLNGISNTTHNLFQSLLYAIPGFVQIIESQEKFIENNHNSHKGFSGFDYDCSLEPYIKSLKTWHDWKIQWYRMHGDKINWLDSKDEFLPNIEYSNEILLQEIIKHKKEHMLKIHNNKIGITFHEEVMKHKGPEIEAYTIEVGKQVAEANYYVYEPNLSNNEQEAAKGSLRNIYSISKNGYLQFISLDHLHGMFEYHNHKGEHLGEFKFDSSFNSKAEASHNFKTI